MFCQERGYSLAPHSESNQSLELFNDAADKLRELHQRWDNRLVLEGHSFVEVYKHGRLTIVCDLEFSSLRKGNDSSFESKSQSSPLRASVIFQSKIRKHSELYDWKQKHVFVEDVKFVESADGFIPSIVRFYDIHNEVDDLFGGLVYVSTLNGSYKIIPGAVDRKLSVFGSSASNFEQNIAHGEIQSALEIVDGISDEQCKIVWNGLCLSDLQNILIGIRVVLNEQSVEVSCLKEFEPTVKVVDVLFGPFNL